MTHIGKDSALSVKPFSSFLHSIPKRARMDNQFLQVLSYLSTMLSFSAPNTSAGIGVSRGPNGKYLFNRATSTIVAGPQAASCA